VALTTYPYSAEVKERVDLCLYSLSGPSWPVIGGTLLTLYYHIAISNDTAPHSVKVGTVAECSQLHNEISEQNFLLKIRGSKF
jgi:hypothetical protein